jgi:hypothetical protein
MKKNMETPRPIYFPKLQQDDNSIFDAMKATGDTPENTILDFCGQFKQIFLPTTEVKRQQSLLAMCRRILKNRMGTKYQRKTIRNYVWTLENFRLLF